MTNIQISDHRFGWAVKDWASAAGISRASVYQILPEIESIKFGGKRLILTHPRDWLESLRNAPTMESGGGQK